MTVDLLNEMTLIKSAASAFYMLSVFNVINITVAVAVVVCFPGIVKLIVNFLIA